MAARKKDNQINLIPKDKFAESTAGRVLAWLLSTFRIIVIVVEMVVMLAFLSRFWLDAKNADLNDEIKQKSSQLQALQPFEKDFARLQTRIKVFTALASQEGLSQDIQKIASYMPVDIFLTSFTKTGNDIKIAGASPSELSIAQFIVNLESDDDFKEISLANVSVGEFTEGLIEFGLTITLNR
jgi:Tfp pilus assembly protein PilN